jgi:hypothetical protein
MTIHVCLFLRYHQSPLYRVSQRKSTLNYNRGSDNRDSPFMQQNCGGDCEAPLHSVFTMPALAKVTITANVFHVMTSHAASTEKVNFSLNLLSYYGIADVH